VTNLSTRTVRVLIMDGDVRVRRALRALLEAVPHMVVVGEAETAASAVERARVLHPTVTSIGLMYIDLRSVSPVLAPR
jgi:DNA-binding NarL/FixJ family response regulator